MVVGLHWPMGFLQRVAGGTSLQHVLRVWFSRPQGLKGEGISFVLVALSMYHFDLFHCLYIQVKSDEIHKLAQAKYAEDEEILRVPIAMAMIKLLQKMPDGALKYKLPG